VYAKSTIASSACQTAAAGSESRVCYERGRRIVRSVTRRAGATRLGCRNFGRPLLGPRIGHPNCPAPAGLSLQRLIKPTCRRRRGSAQMQPYMSLRPSRRPQPSSCLRGWGLTGPPWSTFLAHRVTERSNRLRSTTAERIDDRSACAIPRGWIIPTRASALRKVRKANGIRNGNSAGHRARLVADV
jgi:hypothetical protein